METGGELSRAEPLSIEQGQTKGSENHKYGLTSAHTTDHGMFALFLHKLQSFKFHCLCIVHV
jgi:hypothetical protein